MKPKVSFILKYKYYCIPYPNIITIPNEYFKVETALKLHLPPSGSPEGNKLAVSNRIPRLIPE